MQLGDPHVPPRSSVQHAHFQEYLQRHRALDDGRRDLTSRLRDVVRQDVELGHPGLGTGWAPHPNTPSVGRFFCDNGLLLFCPRLILFVFSYEENFGLFFFIQVLKERVLRNQSWELFPCPLLINFFFQSIPKSAGQYDVSGRNEQRMPKIARPFSARDLGTAAHA